MASFEPTPASSAEPGGTERGRSGRGGVELVGGDVAGIRTQAFRGLCGAVGLLFILGGLGLSAQFFVYQQPHSQPSIPTGPVGYYFVAFSGAALVAWGGALIGAARDPATGRAIAAASAFALTLMAFVRIIAWVIGDYYQWLGELPRYEAAFFLVLALGFVWLRPPAHSRSGAAETA